MNSFNDVWLSVLEVIKQETTQVMYNLYPSALVFEKYSNDTVVLSTDKDYKKRVIDEKFADRIKEIFNEILGFPVDLEIIIYDPEKDDPAEKENIIEEDSQRSLTARYTFESFVTGNENQLAYNIALGAAEAPGRKYNPVMIYGASGLGKTHLLLAAYNKMLAKNPNASIIVTSGENFMNELFEHIERKDSISFHKKYRNADALFIDDIQFIARGGKSVQEEIFYCFESLYNAGKQIFMISDRPPKEMNTLEDRLRSRFSSGVIQDINPPEKDTRIIIIQKKAEHLGINIPLKTAEFIADKIKTNVRQLEGVVNNIEAHSTITGTVPSLEQVKKIINEITNENQPASVIVDKILERVSTDMGVSVDEIKSKKRDKKIKDARQVCIYVIKQKTNLTLAEIGDIFGISHSTVIHSCSQIEAEQENNASLKVALENIISDFMIN